MQIFIAGNVESRRTAYFIKAGDELHIDIRFISYKELEQNLSLYTNTIIKLEPPCYNETDFVAYNELCYAYIRQLRRIDAKSKAESVRFINSPSSILLTLDKSKTKEVLSGLRTTPLLPASASNFEELIEITQKQKRKNIFLKPRYGSGAGGIMALRIHPLSGDIRAYTTLKRINGHFYNTKHIYPLRDTREIAPIANVVLKAGAIVEQWVMKDETDEGNYDLRVVSQFGKVEHVVVRYSKGTITNLHLNNKPGTFDDLSLPSSLKDEIAEQCLEANRLLGLNYSGTDILIEKDTLKPYIIEVNGQGDHIYQDIFNENNIYKKQIKHQLCLPL